MGPESVEKDLGQVGKGRACSLKDSLQLSTGPHWPGNLRWEAGVGGMCMENATRSKWPSWAGVVVGGSCFSIFPLFSFQNVLFIQPAICC